MSAVGASVEFRNSILAKSSKESVTLLSLKPIELEVNFSIYEPNQRIESVFFLEVGVLSVVSAVKNGASIEIGTIGREGVSGAELLLDVDSSPFHCFVQVAGHGHYAKADDFCAVAAADADFWRHVFMHNVE